MENGRPGAEIGQENKAWRRKMIGRGAAHPAPDARTPAARRKTPHPP